MQPDYIFETSWEVCNRVGGIYAVLSTRAASMQAEHPDKVFFFGPDFGNHSDIYFKEDKSLLSEWNPSSFSLGEGRGEASTIHPFTFLAGRDYEGTPHGMYILSIGDGKVASIQVLDSGSFVYRGDSLLFTLYYRNSRGEKCTYRPVFGGSLLPYNPNQKP